MTREEAFEIARHVAAGAMAMRGTSEDFCRYMREGAYDDEPTVQAAAAAFLMAAEFRGARLEEIRKREKAAKAATTNVLDFAA